MYKYSVKDPRQAKANSITEDINTKLKIKKNKKSVSGILKESTHLHRNPQDSNKSRKYHRDGVTERTEDDHRSNKKEIKDLINQIRSEVDFTQNPYDVIEAVEDLIWLEESIRDSSSANKVRYMAMGINTIINPDLSVLKRKMKEYQEVLEVNEAKNKVEKWSDVKEHLLDIICEYSNEKVFKVPLLKNCYNNWRVWVERVLANIWCGNYSVKELKEEISRGKGYPAEWSGIDFAQTPRQIKDKLIKYSECTEGSDKKSIKITAESIINLSTKTSTKPNHKKPEKRTRKVNTVMQDISNYKNEQGEESSLNIQCTEHVLKRDLYNTGEINQNNRIEEEIEKTSRPDKVDRISKIYKADKVYKVDREDREDKIDKVYKADREDKVYKADRPDRPDKIDREDKLYKADKADRPDKPDKADRADRPDRPDRPDKADKTPSFYFEGGGKRALLQVREISPL
ncbi:hypothetical protein NEPAR04_0770 [Nematocida parisii]|nr:hypothetical protein NEPAR08_0771 [Nematocida parisii]KAI5127646.1 hypothetical protein NEPAR03_1036 [Nematocida parisii]KAI5141199.1 hypothetical protein NEPAR04_0770 [Nematocida parisii]